jgi:type I restriction enzyme, S subunit
MKENIPDGWELKKIGSILKVKHGKNQKDVEIENGKYPILGTGGVIGRTNTYLYDKPSVLIGRKGTIDRPQYMETPFWTVDTLFYTEIKNNYHPKWLYYKFCSIPWKKYNEATGVPSLSASTIQSIKIEVPSINEQEKIAEILSTLDKAIELKEKLINQKKELKEGLSQKLLTGEKRLPGYEGDWKEVKLGDLVERVIDNRGKTPPTTNFGYELIEVNAFEGNGRNPDYSKIKKYVDVKTFNSWFRNGHPIKNDILVATVGSVGATVIMEENRGCIAQNIIALRIKKDYSPEFIYYWMNSGSYFRLVKKVLMGAVQPSLKVPHLLQFKLKLPSLKEQYEIAKIFILIDDYIKLLENEVNQLNLQKKGLMQQLLTGKVRVKV